MIEEKVKLENIEINVKYELSDKPAVLFIHFSGGNLNMWDGVLPLFRNYYSVIIPDIRGHGKSDKPLEGYHIDDMASDIFSLLRKLKVERCHIVGSSMGAEVGLSLAAAHPELILSLVCEGALYNEFGEHGLFNGTEAEIKCKKEEMRLELATREERVFKTIEEFLEEERVKLTQQGIWTEHFLPFLKNNLQRMDNGNFTYCYLNRVRTEYIEKYWNVRFEQYYKKVSCPILFLLSEEEWKDENIRKHLSVFTALLDVFEMKYIEKAIHAYVWMQFPIVAGEVAKNFIGKYSLSN